MRETSLEYLYLFLLTYFHLALDYGKGYSFKSIHSRLEDVRLVSMAGKFSRGKVMW